MEYEFAIIGRYYKNRTLPGLNEYLQECGKNPRAGARMKKEYQMIICNAIRRQLGKLHVTNQVIIHYKFYEIDKRRDKSNIFAVAAKYIEDALQVCRVLENDSWKEIKNFTHEYYVDAEHPRIEVVLEEVDGWTEIT